MRSEKGWQEAGMRTGGCTDDGDIATGGGGGGGGVGTGMAGFVIGVGGGWYPRSCDTGAEAIQHDVVFLNRDGLFQITNQNEGEYLCCGFAINLIRMMFVCVRWRGIFWS